MRKHETNANRGTFYKIRSITVEKCQDRQKQGKAEKLTN